MEYYKIISWTECPFCLRAKTLMIEKGLQFEYCSIDHSRKLLDYYKKVYKHDTVPMVIKINTENGNEQFIGGYTELKESLKDT
jgi:glutaredoxin 3